MVGDGLDCMLLLETSGSGEMYGYRGGRGGILVFRHCQDKTFFVPVLEGGSGLWREMYESDQSLNFTNTINWMKRIEWVSVGQESR